MKALEKGPFCPLTRPGLAPPWCVCLLPGPKTICCKLCYSLFRLMRCPRTWCDWVSIQSTMLKLPASWPQTPVVTAWVQQEECHGAGLRVGKDPFPFDLPPLLLCREPREWGIRDYKDRAPLLCCINLSQLYSPSYLTTTAAHRVGILQSFNKKGKRHVNILFH